MELKAYLKILVRRWWAIVVGLVIAVSAAAIFTFRQEPLYQSKATYVIRPRSSLVADKDFASALDIVSRRSEINTTFAEVSSSRAIRDTAVTTLGLMPAQKEGLTANAVVLSGTNVLTITAEGPNPTIVRDFANAVGQATVSYVSGLYDIFELQPLDSAVIPTQPVSPKVFFNLVISAILGLMLGGGLALLIEYIQSPYSEPDSFNIIDRDTGAYNRPYFMLRTSQEINRARRNDYPLTMVLIKVDLEGENLSARQRRETMRVFKVLAEKTIREDDILACLNGNTFAILFPYMQNAKAAKLAESLKENFGSVARDVLPSGDHFRLQMFSGTSTFKGDQTVGDNLLDSAVRSLESSIANSTSTAAA